MHIFSPPYDNEKHALGRDEKNKQEWQGTDLGGEERRLFTTVHEDRLFTYVIFLGFFSPLIKEEKSNNSNKLAGVSSLSMNMIIIQSALFQAGVSLLRSWLLLIFRMSSPSSSLSFSPLDLD